MQEFLSMAHTGVSVLDLSVRYAAVKRLGGGTASGMQRDPGATQRQAVALRQAPTQQATGAAVPFDEIRHLAGPVDGNRGWAVAGIRQVS